MPARKELCKEHHVMRYVPPSKRFVDPEGRQLGPSPAGFKLRDDDKGGLSVTEIEYYGPQSPETRAKAAAAFKESLGSKKLGVNGIFAYAKIERIKIASLKYDKKIRIVHDPVPGNPGHAEIRHFTDEDLSLLDHFATDVFDAYDVVKDMNIQSIVIK